MSEQDEREDCGLPRMPRPRDPGTSGDDTAIDHCGWAETVEESDGDFLQRIGTDAAEWAAAFCDKLCDGTLNLLTGDRDSVESTMIGWFANAIEAGRSAGDAEELRTMIGDLHEENTRQTAELQTAAQQRDFLMGQCSSLIGRLAGSHLAAGFIDLAGAQGFALKETLPINHMLAQIAAANAPPQQAEAGGDNPDYVEPQP